MARNTENLSHFHGTRILKLSWMLVRSIQDSRPRKKMSKSTFFPNGLSRSPMFWNVEFDDFNTLSTPDTNPFSVTLSVSENFPSPWELCHSSCGQSRQQLYICLQEVLRQHLDRGKIRLYSLPGKSTYNLTGFSAPEMLDNRKSVFSSFGIDINNNELDLPYIYLIPKMHKKPYKLRVIAGSAKCSTNSLFILLTKLLTHIK